MSKWDAAESRRLHAIARDTARTYGEGSKQSDAADRACDDYDAAEPSDPVEMIGHTSRIVELACEYAKQTAEVHRIHDARKAEFGDYPNWPEDPQHALGNAEIKRQGISTQLVASCTAYLATMPEVK